MASTGMFYGIIQGRLSQSKNNQLQCFPDANWENEFKSAHQLGLSYIELIAEEIHNPKNPIWLEDGQLKIKSLNKSESLQPYSICNDYIIQNPIVNDSTITQIKELIDCADKTDLTCLVLPLFKASQVKSDSTDQLSETLTTIADYGLKKNIEISLESELSGKDLVALLKKVNHKNVFCTYDTGNAIVHGHDIHDDISVLSSYINHIHIKDKTLAGENVYLGTGQVNFYKALMGLKSIPYEGGLTFETCRGQDPIKTAQIHLKYINLLREIINNE